MEIPEGMEQLLKMLHDHHHQEEDYSTWVQVGTLNPESAALKLAHVRRLDKDCNERDTLMAKLNALKAKVEAEGMEYWNKLYAIHSLPVDGIYHITEDGKIQMRPKEKKS